MRSIYILNMGVYRHTLISICIYKQIHVFLLKSLNALGILNETVLFFTNQCSPLLCLRSLQASSMTFCKNCFKKNDFSPVWKSNPKTNRNFLSFSLQHRLDLYFKTFADTRANGLPFNSSSPFFFQVRLWTLPLPQPQPHPFLGLWVFWEGELERGQKSLTAYL